MFPVEIVNARRMSQDRYTCEAVFSRTTFHKLLKGILKYEHMRYVNDAAHCGHFSAQLMQPMIEPACWKSFVNESRDHSKYPVPLDLTPLLRTGKNGGESGTRIEGPDPSVGLSDTCSSSSYSSEEEDSYSHDSDN